MLKQKENNYVIKNRSEDADPVSFGKLRNGKQRQAALTVNGKAQKFHLLRMQRSLAEIEKLAAQRFCGFLVSS